jgi:hypothetical protein
MILFSLMSTWMWFQIFTTSRLSSNRRANEISDACLSLLLIPFKGGRT